MEARVPQGHNIGARRLSSNGGKGTSIKTMVATGPGEVASLQVSSKACDDRGEIKVFILCLISPSYLWDKN